MAEIVSTHDLYDALKAEGFPIPNECGEVRLIMGVDAALMLEYDVFVTDENLVKLGRALQRMGTPNVAVPSPTSPNSRVVAPPGAVVRKSFEGG